MTLPEPRARTSEITRGPLTGAILRLALPAVGATLLQLVFLLIDTFWVGRILGPPALAAVSTAGFAVWMLASFGEMVGVGLTAVAARRHGEGAHDIAARVAGSTLITAVAGGLVLGLAGRGLIGTLFGLMDTPAVVTALGRDYLATYLLGAPLILGFFAVEATFRASGDTRTPLLLLLVSVIVNAGLDPLLIRGVGPLAPLGIRGAAVAALLTRGSVLVVGCVLLIRRRLVRTRGYELRSVLTACRVGLPTAGTGVFFSAVYMGLTRYTTRFGVPALAALGIGHKLEGLSYMVATGFALASAAVVGQNIGAGRMDRARRAGWITSGLACSAGGVVALLFVFAPHAMIGVFTNDPAVIRDASGYLLAMALAQVTMGLEIVLESSMGGAGYTIAPMLVTCGFSAARIPLAAWLSGPLGLWGVWLTIGATAACRGILMALLWKSRRWEGVRV